MRPVVLDTDVVSFLFKQDTRAALYVDKLRDRQLLISFMTEAELEQWVLLSNWGAQRIEWLRLYLSPLSSCLLQTTSRRNQFNAVSESSAPILL